MRGAIARSILLACALALGACGLRLTRYAGYHGDGTFTPIPAPAAICQDGYTVDLGAIDLTHAGSYDYTLAGLPSIEAIVGIALTRAAASDADRYVPRPHAEIELTLRRADGQIVLARNESLERWTASVALAEPSAILLYRRGGEFDVPVAPGSARAERFPIGPDDSWGTYFTPPRDARYALHFSVATPDAELHDVAAHLQIDAVVGCL